MEVKENQQFHLGVYGIYIVDGKVLVIEKGKGPYKGLYDLPGGRIEFGEPVETTLKREIQEEVGGSLISFNFLGYNQYFCNYTNEKGENKNFHHVGFYFIVECDIENLKVDADGHDSLGAMFVEIDTLTKSNCSQIAFEMIQKANVKQ